MMGRLLLIFVVISKSVFVLSSVETSGGLLLKQGDEATFWCDSELSVTRAPLAWMRWNVNGSKEIVANKGFALNNNVVASNFILYKVLGTRVQRYSLVIKNVNYRDSGTYECQFELDNGTVVFNRTSLQVFSSEEVIPTVSVLQGDSAVLRCFSEKYRVFDVVWWRNKKEELPEGSYIRNGLLTIPSSSVQDSDFYTCSASYYKISTKKDTIARTIKLDVSPELELIVRNAAVIRPTGYSANITCVIISLSPVKVKWIKSGVTITPSEKYRHDLFENENGAASQYAKKSTKVAQLYIKNIEMKDYGTYECVVENKFNILSKEIQLLNPPFLYTDGTTEPTDEIDSTTHLFV